MKVEKKSKNAEKKEPEKEKKVKKPKLGILISCTCVECGRRRLIKGKLCGNCRDKARKGGFKYETNRI